MKLELLYKTVYEVCLTYEADIHSALCDGGTINGTCVSASCADTGDWCKCTFAEDPLLTAEGDCETMAVGISELGVQSLHALAQFLGGLNVDSSEVAEGDVAELTIETFDGVAVATCKTADDADCTDYI